MKCNLRRRVRLLSMCVNVISTGLGLVALSLSSPNLRVSVMSMSVKLLFISVHISRICSLSCRCLLVFVVM